MDKEVRLRFAPSPTGVLHIGGVRTALYNYLFAKKHGGKLILRIEDTDQNRFVEGAEEYIKNALSWCGIEFDESSDKGGEYAPYRQSERKDIYVKYAQQMIDEGNAYYAFDSSEELDELRERLKEAKASAQTYNSVTRNQMKNSLTMSKEEVAEKLANGDPYVIRIKVPVKDEIRLKDMVRGWVNVHSSTIDDKVLMKSDGMPTYHLANVVDDRLMKITHVIRGEEWLPSAPIHVLLYQFLGWGDAIPEMAHLPLLLKPDGTGKLSKRDAEKHGFPIFPLAWQGSGEDALLKGFREEGYVSDAFVNFLAFLGWNPGTEKEIYSMDELIQDFSFEQVNKSGAKFDIQKAIWFNQQYIRSMSVDQLTKEFFVLAKEHNITCEESKALQIVTLLQERVDVLPELITKGAYFFGAPTSYGDKVVQKKWNAVAKSVFTDLAEGIKNTSALVADDFQSKFNEALEKNETQAGQVMQVLRIAITGEAGGPDLMKIMEVIGTQAVSERIYKAIDVFDQLS